MKHKPKIIKNCKIEYNGATYENIISISRGYDYSSFSYLDDKGSECSIYVAQGQSFTMINDKLVDK